MSVNEKIDVFRIRQRVGGDCPEPASLVPRPVRSACIRAALREARCPIGMQRPKCSDRKRMSHDGTNHPVAAILFVAQSVAVLDPNLPSSNRSLPRTNHVGDSDVIAQNLSAPAIVIARDPQYVDAGILEIGQSGQCAKAVSWNHRLPLEPEIEEVAIYDERARFARKAAQKPDKGALDLWACDAQMRVRHDVAGTFEHGTS